MHLKSKTYAGAALELSARELCSRCGKPRQPRFHRRSENAPQPWRFCMCGDRAHFPLSDAQA